MTTKDWFFSATFLPYTGEPIDFRLEDRETPISGTYVDGKFHSRWADFSPDRVLSWREAVVDPTRVPIATLVVTGHRKWALDLKRLARRLLPIRGGKVSAQAVVPVVPMAAVQPLRSPGMLPRVSKRYPDSNQTTS
jgi:hypothetical protein